MIRLLIILHISYSILFSQSYESVQDIIKNDLEQRATIMLSLNHDIENVSIEINIKVKEVLDGDIKRIKDGKLKWDTKKILYNKCIDSLEISIVLEDNQPVYDKIREDLMSELPFSRSRGDVLQISKESFNDISEKIAQKNDSERLKRLENIKSRNDSLNQELGEYFEAMGISPPTDSYVEFIPYDEPPRPMKPIRPKYPEFAQEMGIEGVVIVQVYIDELGNVKETKVIKGIPNTGLDEAAIEAIGNTTFWPALQKDKPIGVWISVPIYYKLKK